jgi:hypothetical protein
VNRRFATPENHCWKLACRINGSPKESKEELMKWVLKCLAEEGDVIEVRQVFDLADFGIKQ